MYSSLVIADTSPVTILGKPISRSHSTGTRRRTTPGRHTPDGRRTSREKGVSITYRGMTFNENLRYDLLVDDCLLIEAKSCEKEYMDLWRMQLLTYMKLMDKPLGLVINFGNEHLPKRGVKRVILKDADDETAPF